MKQIKIVVFVPLTHTDIVREAMGDAGAGVLGKYHHASFPAKEWGGLLPLKVLTQQ